MPQDYTSKFRVDISDLKKNISTANQIMKLANAEFAAATAGMDDWSKSADGISAKLAQLKKTLDAQKAVLAAYRDEMERQQRAHDESGKRAEELRAAMQDLRDKGVSPTSAEYKAYETELKAAESAQEKNAKAVDNLQIKILQQEAAVGKTEKELRQYDGSLDDVEKSSEETAVATKDLGKETESAGGKIEGAGKLIGKAAKAIVSAAAAIGAAAVAAGKKMWDMANDVAASGEEIDKESQKLGLSAEAYQELSYAMDMSGSSISDLSKGMINITNALADTANGVKGADKNFTALGVSLKNADGSMKTTEQVLLDTIGVLADMDDEVQRNAAAQDIFGKSAKELAPLLNEGADGIAALMQEAQEYGVVMSGDAVAASANFDDSLTRLQGSLQGTKTRIVGDMLPGLSQLLDGFAGLVAGVDGADENISHGAEGIAAAIQKMVPLAVSALGGIITAILNVAPSILDSIVTGIVPVILQTIPTLLPTLLRALLDLIMLVVSNAGNLIQPILLMLPDLLKMIFSEFVPQLIRQLALLLPVIIDSILGALPDIISVLLGDALPEILIALIQYIPPAIFQIAKSIISNFGPIVESIFTGLGKAAAKLGGWLWPNIGKPVVDAFKNAWSKIKETFSAVGQWFKTKVTDPVANFFTGMWNGLKSGALGAWNGIKNVFSSVTTWFRDKFSEAWSKVKSVFASGGKIFDGIKDGITEAFKKVVNVLIRGINRVVSVPFNAINSALQKLKDVSILNFKPFDWIKTITVPQIPELARGGVLRRGQIGLLEGSGAEAVVPLERNKAWIDAVAASMSRALGSAGAAPSTTYNLTQINNSPKPLSRWDIYRQTNNLLAFAART